MNKVELQIDYCSHKASKYAVERWHYSKTLPVPPLVKIGVWENSKFIGVVIFSRGASCNLLKPYGLKQTEGCELTRVALNRHKTPVTRIIKIAVLFLKKSSKNLRLIVSFADPKYGHHGGIYQGGNWIYSIYVLWAIALFSTVFFASTGINIYVGMALFTLQSVFFGPFLGLIMLEMDENDGYKALKIVFLVTLLTGFVGYSDIYSFSDNNFLGVENVNLGTGIGYSVLDLIHTFEKVNSVTVPYEISNKREGDIAVAFADPSHAFKCLSWRSKKNLEDMCRDVWRWSNTK